MSPRTASFMKHRGISSRTTTITMPDNAISLLLHNNIH
jgi:hypothetical protein